MSVTTDRPEVRPGDVTTRSTTTTPTPTTQHGVRLALAVAALAVLTIVCSILWTRSASSPATETTPATLDVGLAGGLDVIERRILGDQRSGGLDVIERARQSAAGSVYADPGSAYTEAGSMYRSQVPQDPSGWTSGYGPGSTVYREQVPSAP